ncbi:MAG: hypothetical protein OXC00_00670, partial [Acidimicrobiaceae bacterium]|nr:hypothetical protein [Acidimicrobiaceae bacterium]
RLHRNPPAPTDTSTLTPQDALPFTINADGTNNQQIATDTDGWSWSPDGTRIAYTNVAYSSEGDLFTINADGTNNQQITTSAEVASVVGWSPDGTRIAYTTINALYVVDWAG